MPYHVVILAGGKSERFGSNKALYTSGSVSLLGRQVREVLKAGQPPESIIVSLHEEKEEAEIVEALRRDVGLAVDGRGKGTVQNIPISFVFDTDVTSLDDGSRAPILGLSAAFKRVGKGQVQVLPCDTPQFDAAVITYLRGRVEGLGEPWDAVLPQWNNGYIEPLHGTYKVEEFSGRLERCIASGDYKLLNILVNRERIVHVSIEAEIGPLHPGVDVFLNVNAKDGIPDHFSSPEHKP